jgi:hypothetical protein
MPEQSTIFQCVPIDDDSDDGHVDEFKIETNSTSSSSLIDYNSIHNDGSTSSHRDSNIKRSNRNNNSNSNDIRHFTINLAASSQRRMQAGCHSAAATVDDAFQSVDDAFESAVDLFIPTTGCNPDGRSGRKSEGQAVNPYYQDDHTIEVDYNGTLHTIVSGSSKSGKDDEIILVPKEKGFKQRPKRFRIIGRLFRPKTDSKKAILVDNPTTSHRAPKPVSPSPPVAAVAIPTRQQRAITTVSPVVERKQQQKTTRREANNDNNAVVVRSFGDTPQYMQPQQPKQQQQARALKSKSVNQAAGTTTTTQRKKQSSSPSPSSSWWGKNSKKKQLNNKQSSLETQRYVHEQEESIQEGDTNVLMIRMHRTPTNDMVPQIKR